MANMNSGYSEQATEIYIKKVLAGNIENVRQRIIGAIEEIGYDIIEDESHIVARRSASGWGTWFASANVLDYAMTLTVRLKSVGESSTQAVFDYSVNHGFLSKGEKEVVLQEAKTIVSLSKMQAIEKMCSVCETESTDDSKFCRKCGAPLTSEQAELEVLRMMAETRAGKTSVVASSVSMIFSVLIFILTFVLNNAELIKPKLVVVLFAIGGIGVFISLMASLFGWNRLKRALEKTDTKSLTITDFVPATVKTREFHALPPHRVPASVTEGTTNLLDQEFANRREKVKVPASHNPDTNELD